MAADTTHDHTCRKEYRRVLVMASRQRPTCRECFSERSTAMLDFERAWWNNDEPREPGHPGAVPVFARGISCGTDHRARRPRRHGPRPARCSPVEAAPPACTQGSTRWHRRRARERKRSDDQRRSGRIGSGADPPRKTPRQGIGGSPVGSTLSIVLAVVAVVAGFLILRNITDDDDGASPDGRHGAADAAKPRRPRSISPSRPRPWCRPRRSRRS